jgi:hypothetical protein
MVELVCILILCAVVFGLCYLTDMLFKKLFRSQKQHLTGRSVRINKRFGSFGALMIVLGIASIFACMNGSGKILGAGGALVLVVGIGLVIYYVSFGIYYDDDSFYLNTFLKKGTSYDYDQIVGQRLYTASGNILIELHLKDGRTVGLQANMEGVYPFLDEAFAGWCRQTEHDPNGCDFHDPSQSKWFPMVEDL